MELMKAVSERRSIRAFVAGEVITKEQVEELVACAQLAPSWKNSQTARYYAAVSKVPGRK